MEDKLDKKLTAENVKQMLDQSCSEIMKAKEIKPDLHRQ